METVDVSIRQDGIRAGERGASAKDMPKYLTEPERKVWGEGWKQGRVKRRNRQFTEYMTQTQERLLKITAKCRLDMHEPDEQGIYAHVHGDHLDNAMGDRVDETPNYQEYVVELMYQPGGEDTDVEAREYFNLATLIALARKARP